MEKIALLIDSTCSLPDEYLQKYPVFVARLKVIYHRGEYIDGIDITPHEVYSHLSEELPTTSMPSVDDLCALYETMISEGYTHVIGMPISSGLSGTAQQYEDRITSCIFDFKHLSMAIGLSVIEIGEMILKGLSYSEICRSLPNLQARTRMYFTVDTLEYLIRGGRIGHVSGRLGEFLKLKPIITMAEDGSYTTLKKVRGSKQAFSALVDQAHSLLDQKPCKIVIMTGTMLEEANQLKAAISTHPNLISIDIGIITPVVGIHSGPRLLAFTALMNESL